MWMWTVGWSVLVALGWSSKLEPDDCWDWTAIWTGLSCIRWMEVLTWPVWLHNLCCDNVSKGNLGVQTPVIGTNPPALSWIMLKINCYREVFNNEGNSLFLAQSCSFSCLGGRRRSSSDNQFLPLDDISYRCCTVSLSLFYFYVKLSLCRYGVCAAP